MVLNPSVKQYLDFEDSVEDCYGIKNAVIEPSREKDAFMTVGDLVPTTQQT